MMHTMSDEDFVRIWQAGESVGEISKTTGMGKASLHSKASKFRSRGVPLKRFPCRVSKSKEVWERLAKIADTLNKSQDSK